MATRPSHMSMSLIGLSLMLGLARILGLVLVRLRCVAATQVLPILNLFTSLLALLNHDDTIS